MVLDVFPGSNKESALSFNAISRLILFGGISLYCVERKPMFLAGTALLMLYMFGEQNKFKESYYMNTADMKLEDDVAPKTNPKKAAIKQEAQATARRMIENPRDLQSRAAIVPTVDDKVFATRPTPGVGGDWKETRFPEYMSGAVGWMKSSIRPY